MQIKDYYTELGVASDADEQAIKKAYRKLARQYHPDVNPDDETAAERFKAVNEAYQVLGDTEKRQRYDEMRQQRSTWQHFGGPGNDTGQWQDVFGGRVYGQGVAPEDLQDMFDSDIFASIFGSGFERGPSRGRDVEVNVEITLEEVLHGTSRTIQVGDHRIEARIPAGVKTGSRVRLAGQGQPASEGGSPGDLFFVIQVLPDPRFEREGNNLTTKAAVDFYAAALGGDVRVTTLDGTVRLKIPPRTQSGKQFRLRGKGLPTLQQADQRGDLYVKIEIVLPEDLADTELAQLRELAQARQGESVESVAVEA